jgi:predicted DNA-binding transcriptional regulator AlpA
MPTNSHRRHRSAPSLSQATKRRNKIKAALRKVETAKPPTTDDLLLPDDILVAKDWLAKQLGVSVYTIARMVNEGAFPRPIEIGPQRRQRWRIRDYRTWLEQKASETLEAV